MNFEAKNGMKTLFLGFTKSGTEYYTPWKRENSREYYRIRKEKFHHFGLVRFLSCVFPNTGQTEWFRSCLVLRLYEGNEYCSQQDLLVIHLVSFY